MSKSLIRQSEEAHNEYVKLVDILKTGKKLDVLKGKQLWVLKSNNLFKKAVGQGIDKWHDFLALPEIGLDNREANRLMDIYDVFVVKHKIPEDELAEAKIKSLHYLLPIARDGKVQNVREYVQLASTLSQSDFRESVYDLKTQDLGARTYIYLIMKKCVETGTMTKVHNISSEEIKDKFDLDD